MIMIAIINRAERSEYDYNTRANVLYRNSNGEKKMAETTSRQCFS